MDSYQTENEPTDEESAQVKKPRLWLVGILSIVTPGLGQLYVGRPFRGLIFFLIALTLANGMCASMIFVDAAPLNMILAGLLLLMFFLAPLLDALRTAKRCANLSGRPKWIKSWPILISLAISFTVAASYGIPVWGNYRGFVIPAASMEDALLVGDYLLAETGAGIPLKRGDLVIFKFPMDERVSYVKRLIGLPGDTVFISNKRLYINGKAFEEPETVKFTNPSIKQNRRPHPRGEDWRSGGQPDNFGPYTVPRNNLFLLGDNRDNSFDSRFWGPAPVKNVLGKAIRIYWSKEPARIGKAVD